MGATSKYALRYPAGSDPSTIATYFQNLASDVDGVVASFDHSTARPAAGKEGRIHLQPSGGSGTPPTNTLSYDDGTAWRVLGVLDPTTGLIVPSLAGAAHLTTYDQTLVDLGSMGSSKNIDLSLGREFKGVLSASSCTLAFTNVPSTANTRLTVGLKLAQDSTGARSVTWPGSVSWGSLSAPALTATPSKSDWLSFVSDDAGSTWIGFKAEPGGF
jgi:hypothetical protein